MEINTEQLEALLRQQEQQAGTVRRQTGQSGGFDAILAQQLGTGTEQANAAASPLSPGAAQAGMISQMLLNGAGQSQAAIPTRRFCRKPLTRHPARWISGIPMPKPWVRPLTGVPCATRMPLLQGIDSQVTQIKQGTAGVRGKNPVSIRC